MSDIMFGQLKQVRDIGNVNMLDYRGVNEEAEALGLNDLLVWFDCNALTDYFNMLTGEFSEWLENQAAVEYLEAKAKEPFDAP